MAGILEKMGVKNKKALKVWQKQEKIKMVAIAYAFSMQTDDKIEINCQEKTEKGHDR